MSPANAPGSLRCSANLASDSFFDRRCHPGSCNFILCRGANQQIFPCHYLSGSRARPARASLQPASFANPGRPCGWDGCVDDSGWACGRAHEVAWATVWRLGRVQPRRDEAGGLAGTAMWRRLRARVRGGQGADCARGLRTAALRRRLRMAGSLRRAAVPPLCLRLFASTSAPPPSPPPWQVTNLFTKSPTAQLKLVCEDS